MSLPPNMCLFPKIQQLIRKQATLSRTKHENWHAGIPFSIPLSYPKCKIARLEMFGEKKSGIRQMNEISETVNYVTRDNHKNKFSKAD